MSMMRERKPKTPDELRMCLECKKFFIKRTFYKHKEACNSQAQPVKTQTLRPLDLPHDDEFVLIILNYFAMVLLKVISDKVGYFKLLDINITWHGGLNPANLLK